MNGQQYKVNVSFTIEPPVFPGDPDDVYELANLELISMEKAIESLSDQFDGTDLTMAVEPIIL